MTNAMSTLFSDGVGVPCGSPRHSFPVMIIVEGLFGTEQLCLAKFLFGAWCKLLFRINE
jgi:hypothetical protein